LAFAPGATATIAGGVLTVTSGATSETLHLIGINNATTFRVTADASNTGTDITINTAPPPPSSTPPAAIAAFDTSTNQPLGVVGKFYTGPVVGLQNEYINIHGRQAEHQRQYAQLVHSFGQWRRCDRGFDLALVSSACRCAASPP
jgi:hypothetical protein